MKSFVWVQSNPTSTLTAYWRECDSRRKFMIKFAISKLYPQFSLPKYHKVTTLHPYLLFLRSKQMFSYIHQEFALIPNENICPCSRLRHPSVTLRNAFGNLPAISLRPLGGPSELSRTCSLFAVFSMRGKREKLKRSAAGAPREHREVSRGS